MTPRAAEPPDLVPEIAPRLGIDARRRLVEQQQLRLVDQARRERQPLLPAARQRARELLRAIGEPEIVERRRRRAACAGRAGTSARRNRGSRGSSGPRRARISASCSRPASLICAGLACARRSRGRCPRPRPASAGRRACGWSWSCPSRWARESRRSRPCGTRMSKWSTTVRSPKRLVRPVHIDDRLRSLTRSAPTRHRLAGQQRRRARRAPPRRGRPAGCARRASRSSAA